MSKHEIFKETIDGVEYEFRRVYYSSYELMYHVHFFHQGRSIIFRVRKDEEGIWKIAAQTLPLYVHELGLKLHDVLENNEGGNV